MHYIPDEEVFVRLLRREENVCGFKCVIEGSISGVLLTMLLLVVLEDVCVTGSLTSEGVLHSPAKQMRIAERLSILPRSRAAWMSLSVAAATTSEVNSLLRASADVYIYKYVKFTYSL